MTNDHKGSMKIRNPVVFVVFLVSLFPCVGQEGMSEDVYTLNPFMVSGEQDSGYLAMNALAGTRMRTQLEDLGSSFSSVNAEFIEDSNLAVPNTPVSIVRKADALLIQYALASIADKAEVRNAELNDWVSKIAEAVNKTEGLRFEPREIHFASADRKRTLLGKGEAVVSFAHFVIFVDLSADTRTYQRVKEIRDLMVGMNIETPSLKLVDGPVGLFIRRPGQYRKDILSRIFEDLEIVKKGLGSDFEVMVEGLSNKVEMRVCSETEIEMWIDCDYRVRSIREIVASGR